MRASTSEPSAWHSLNPTQILFGTSHDPLIRRLTSALPMLPKCSVLIRCAAFPRTAISPLTDSRHLLAHRSRCQVRPLNLLSSPVMYVSRTTHQLPCGSNPLRATLPFFPTSPLPHGSSTPPSWPRGDPHSLSPHPSEKLPSSSKSQGLRPVSVTSCFFRERE